LFWWHCFPSSSPRHAKAGEEGFSSPPLQILCLSLSLSPLQTQKQLTDPHFSHGLPLRWKNKGDKLADGPREAAQWPLSHPTHSAWLDKGRMALSIFPFYKYSLTRQWGGGGEDERREYERTKKKDKIKGQRKKERNRSRKTNRETTRGRKKNRDKNYCYLFLGPQTKKK
jgi:hypothetical protein